MEQKILIQSGRNCKCAKLPGRRPGGQEDAISEQGKKKGTRKESALTAEKTKRRQRGNEFTAL